MSRRTLGGGRILGSGRSLNPTLPSTSVNQPSKLHSPSTSSVSLNSQASASQLSSDTQDLVSRISLENGDSSISRTAAAAANTYLACPICNEEMVTLLQLNRHLDDAHRNLEDEQQVEVKDWFQIQVEKAKRFQPLAVLNQKLKGLDVFESNNNPQFAPSVPTRSSTNGLVEPPRLLDPDELVTRAHWQRRSLYDVCLEPMCEKQLTMTTGCVNCRKCGRLFCEEHTMYQMKLSRSAQHDPVRGLWCRVCETCYKSRAGYNDKIGAERDHTAAFKSIRKPVVDRAFLEVSRLEKRLSRLTQLLAELPSEQVQSGTNKKWSFSWQGDQRKKIEQSVVSWEDDASVPRCPFCQQEFTTYTFRRHHCRTCGRVVCGDPDTECSSEVGLDVATSIPRVSEKPANAGKLSIDIRLCRECKSTLFDKRDFALDLAKEPPDARAYKNLVQFERGIRLLLPRFQKLLSALQDPEDPPSPAQLAEASKVRKRLMDSFAQYDVAARRIRDLPTDSPTQSKLQKSIYHQATNFLHLHMLPLKTLPKILKHATPHGRHSDSTSSNGSTPRALAAINSHKHANSRVSLTSDNSTALSALETEERSLRERLIVLEEQKFFVSEMIADANRRRKFDEAASLTMNAEELGKEIDKINGMLEQLDFAGIYLPANGDQATETQA
ncbi:vacuolar segregation protein [Coccidioides immitis RS]|uniref:Vacuolar segregation protein pep7 n=2 Tax=Coccidioides immitis TaxID=5501 RepID=A0A0J8RUV6_COCIT|nr:vacuolar segregation protein [Coccidioides immitis RS]EAS34757.3 vacuolar segregation protein [Coccidioides immitis RS]KMO99931.1 vacuolar segregation protein pep7 [Coccidioides immitis RMSCC 2394]KMU88336.1 vacuolar segregation protein pep7 [Coccidioides immitis H538.4]